MNYCFVARSNCMSSAVARTSSIVRLLITRCEFAHLLICERVRTGHAEMPETPKFAWIKSVYMRKGTPKTKQIIYVVRFSRKYDKCEVAGPTAPLRTVPTVLYPFSFCVQFNFFIHARRSTIPDTKTDHITDAYPTYIHTSSHPIQWRFVNLFSFSAFQWPLSSVKLL